MTGGVPLAILVAVASPRAHAAGTALDGSTGLVALPIADTVPPGRLRASVGLQLVRGWDGAGLYGLPVGFSGGVARGVEVGGQLDRDVTSPDGPTSRAAAGFHLRLRPVEPTARRPGLAFQAAVHGVGGALSGELGVLAAIEGRQTSVALVGGAGLARDGVVWGWQGAGLERDLGRAALVLEESFAGGPSGLRAAEGRAGLRLGVRDRVGLLAWTGGGRADVAPWLGAGVALQLSSADPHHQDTDRDGVPDWTDRCRTAEDKDGFEDEDGCPDLDNDGDGIPDALDLTPNGDPPPPVTVDLPGDTPTLKMRIKPRPMPGPVDPAKRRPPAPEVPHAP